VPVTVVRRTDSHYICHGLQSIRLERAEYIAAGSVLTVGLFYLKITYFGIAVAAVSLALLTSQYVRRHWPAWFGMLLLATLVPFATMNDSYRADIMFAIASGRIRSNPIRLILLLTRNGFEEVIALAEILVLLYLVGQRCATVGDVVCGLFIWISGLFLLSQNLQAATGFSHCFYMRDSETGHGRPPTVR
jgi:hypothetical protein